MEITAVDIQRMVVLFTMQLLLIIACGASDLRKLKSEFAKNNISRSTFLANIALVSFFFWAIMVSVALPLVISIE